MPEEESAAREEPGPEGSSYEQALVNYLEERIKPGLNAGAVPLVARSIAKEIANGGSEQKLAAYLQQRIKPGLNRGAVPMLVRSIAKDLTSGSINTGRVEHGPDEQQGVDDPVTAFEAEMHDLQGELGDDWIVRFSVHRGDAWLTAERTDGGQHVEAATAAALLKAAKLLDRRGGRSTG